MTRVRELAERDIPEAVELLAQVSPEHGWRRREDCAAYFRDILFRNPWRDLDVPSWAAWNRGRMAGFYAVMPRPMLLNGRPLRAAVGCQISVLPEHRRSLATLQLLQACLRGPQDLTLALGQPAEAGIEDADRSRVGHPRSVSGRRPPPGPDRRPTTRRQEGQGWRPPTKETVGSPERS